MKFALVLLLALVVISQQFYLHQQYPRTFWVSGYVPHHAMPHHAMPHHAMPHHAMPHHAIDNYRRLVYISHDDFNPSFAPSGDGNQTDDDQSGFPDTQSRIRGFTSNRLSPPKNEKERFLVGGYGNDGFGNNRFFKTLATITTIISTHFSTAISTSISTFISLSTSTATSTSTTSITSTNTVVVTDTATLTLISVVTCVPALQVAAVPVACAARRKRQLSDSQQFAIVPSETLKFTSTALPVVESELTSESDPILPADNDEKSVNALASSKDETHLDDQDNTRGKRFLKKYQFSTFTSTSFTTSTTTSTTVSTSTSIVPIPTTSVTVLTSILTSTTTTTASSFIFVNQTITQTVNLINPAPIVQCDGAAAATACACLPAGFVVCPAAAG